MHKSIVLKLLPIIVATALSACSGPPREGNGMSPGGGGDGMRAANRTDVGCATAVEPVREQLRETAIALALTPKQQVLWNDYQEKISALMADQMRANGYQLTARHAPQQIESKVNTVRNRLAAMEDIAEQASALYQSLDEAQKKTADQRLAGTVPNLYSGLNCQGSDRSSEKNMGGPSGSGRGGPGGAMGGGMGRF